MSDSQKEYTFKDTERKLREKIERLEIYNRNISGALNEVITLVETHDEELAYDCSKIVDRWSWT